MNERSDRLLFQALSQAPAQARTIHGRPTTEPSYRTGTTKRQEQVIVVQTSNSSEVVQLCIGYKIYKSTLSIPRYSEAHKYSNKHRVAGKVSRRSWTNKYRTSQGRNGWKRHSHDQQRDGSPKGRQRRRRRSINMGDNTGARSAEKDRREGDQQVRLKAGSSMDELTLLSGPRRETVKSQCQCQ